MKRILFILTILLSLSSTVRAQLVINEVSQGTSGNQEYIELVVIGTKTCTDSCADLRGWIVDDNNGWYGTTAISAGCYRFVNNSNWSCVPYGSIIVLYNDGQPNPLVPPNDETDANHDGVYIVPMSSTYIELNSSSPNASNSAYPTTGFVAGGASWTNIALNNNGDAVSVISPANLTVAYHSMTYGNISGGTVHLNGSGGQTNFYATGSSYASSAAWSVGSAPANETPGAPNTPANTTWINSMKIPSIGAGSTNTMYDTICVGQTYTFNGAMYNATGQYADTFQAQGGCDSIVVLDLTVSQLPVAPTVTTPVSWCIGTTATPLTAIGSNLTWYATATAVTGSSTAPTPSTAAAGTTMYYVSQTTGNCESPRAAITVIVNPLPAAPVVTSPVTYCQDQSPVPLTATGNNLQWYTTATGGTATGSITPGTTVPGADTFYVTQTAIGCEGARALIAVTVIPTPPAPVVTTPVVYCRFDAATVLSATGQNLLWYAQATGGTGITTAPVPSTTAGGSTDFYVSQTVTGCESPRADITVTVNAVDAAFTTNVDSICINGILQIQNSSVGANLTCHWNFGNGDTAIGLLSQYQYATPGNFDLSLIIVDNNGCRDTAIDSVTVVNDPLVSVSIPDSVICAGARIDIHTNIAPGYDALVYDFGDGTIDSTRGTATTYAYDQAGLYQLSVQSQFSVCPRHTAAHAITVLSAPAVNLGPDTSICPGNAAMALFNRNPDAGTDTYHWSTGETTPTIQTAQPGSFWLVVDNGHCSTADSMEVYKSCYMDIPNAFTPNSDGINDYFFPRQFLTRALVSFHLQIFSRWGELIFETTSTDGSGWDGRFNGIAQPTGVYIYQVQAAFENGTAESQHGNITLLR